MELTEQQREHFDQALEEVLSALPPQVLRLLNDVPLFVEDYPAPEVVGDPDIRPENLFGLHTSKSLIERNFDDSGVQPNHIFIYRLAHLRHASFCDTQSEREEELRRQIRITVLHELGHYHGLDEDELDQLGYG
jgi:predicted Zn-dependent protease with MMP-like domain